MNKYIKLKKKYPKKKELRWLKLSSVKMDCQEIGDYPHSYLASYKAIKYAWKNTRRISLENALHNKWLKTLPRIYGGYYEKGKNVKHCNKCDSIDMTFEALGDGVGFYEHIWTCDNCGNKIIECFCL